MFVEAVGGKSSSTIMCKDTEREALLQIKKIFVTNHSNVDVDSWVGEECCKWHGVVCDNVTANIIAFKPMANKLNWKNVDYVNIEEVDAQFFESIVLALLRLKHLTYLKLTDIRVGLWYFPFPKLIVSMTNLNYLNFSGNELHGKIPPQFGNLTNIEVLDLSHNYLDGKVPPQFGNLTKLKVLDLSNNWLEGKVPPQLKNLSKLKVLDLSHNHLEGKVPQLGNLTKLKVLDLSWNPMAEVESLRWVSCLSNLQYFGISSLDLSSAFHTLIHAIEQLPSLTTLILSGSVLDNTQLSHLFFNNSAVLSTLTYLDLSMNNLESPLTPNIGNLSSLSYLDLSYNSFNGSIPFLLRNINVLKGLNLKRNEFSQVEGGIWGIMKSPCHFQHLDFSMNNLQDDIELLLEPIGNASRCTTYDLNYLNLNYNQISGSVPNFIGLLTEVEVLDFSYNSIEGNITHLHLDNLSKLLSLDVSFNYYLSVDLSSDWPPPFQLEYLGTTSCKIHHTPQWLQTQTKIQYLDLSNCSISGELHEWFYNTSTLQYLNLSNNFLNGPLPKQFKSENLIRLDLHNNNLSGIIPSWLSYLGDLSVVDLSSNNLFGAIPKTLGHNYCTITMLILSGNKLEGSIPSSLGKCIFLEQLDLYQNRLSGKIPRWIGEKLKRMTILRLQENQFGEFLSGYQGRATIPKSLCKLEYLVILDFQKNQLSGSIPNCWEDSVVQTINFSFNNFSGSIPCSLGNLLELEYLHLSNNKLNGIIPLCLSNLTNLRILNIGENELLGSIPKWIGPRFTRLQVLRLPKNKLNGTIPKNLCNFSHLHILDLSHNQLVGNVPTCLGSLTGINLPITSPHFNEYDDFSSDYVFLSDENKIMETIAGIQREYISFDLNYLATIDLSNNSLVGVIPEELTSLYGLIALNLADNHLTGNIPENIGDMKALETLDLSGNNLCGRIPTSLGNIDSLNHVNFSSNNLSGPIPSSRHFQTFDDPSIYARNPYLCGDPLPKKCFIHDEQPTTPQDQAEDDAEDKRENLWFYLVVMSGVATGFWGIIGILLVKKRWRHALFVRAEDAFDWLYVGVIFKVSKLKKMIKRDGNADQ